MASKVFRVKEGSPIDGIIGELVSNPKLHKRELHDKGYSWSDIHAVWQLGRYSDNFGRDSGYTDLDIARVIVASQWEGQGETGGTETSQPVEDIRFPSPPPPSRRMDNFRKPTWYKRMVAMVVAGKHIAISGPPGIGKSTAVEQFAQSQHKVLVSIGADSGLRRRDLVGSTELVNRHTQYLVAEYAAAAINGWWVKIDEVNAAEPDALMFLNAQISPPYYVTMRGQSFPVHPDFRLFVTYNPGLVGTKPLPDSFKDRFFPIKLEFPGAGELRKLLVANGMPTDGDGMWQNLIVSFGVACWEQHKKGRCRYQITPRRLMDAVVLVGMGEDPHKALREAVVDAVDNPAEAELLNRVLSTLVPGYESPGDAQQDEDEEE